MTGYLEKIMIELPEKYKGAAVTPSAIHLFEVNENAKSYRKTTCKFSTVW